MRRDNYCTCHKLIKPVMRGLKEKMLNFRDTSEKGGLQDIVGCKEYTGSVITLKKASFHSCIWRSSLSKESSFSVMYLAHELLDFPDPELGFSSSLTRTLQGIVFTYWTISQITKHTTKTWLLQHQICALNTVFQFNIEQSRLVLVHTIVLM